MPRRLGFHLQLDTVKGHRYARLVHSVRVEGKPRRVTLVQLGRVTPQQIAHIRVWLARSPLFPPEPGTLFQDLSAVRKRKTWQYGRVALGHFLWRKLGLHRLVLEALGRSPAKLRVAQLIEAMVLNRLDDPTSKYGLLEWLPTSAAPFLIGFRTTGLHENALYRAMDRLGRAQTSLERLVYERVVQPTTRAPSVLYHDLTSSYFEGGGGALGRFGYSRDHRSDRPQVSWGLVVTPEGLPITLQVYPGNTTDKTTVVATVDRLIEQFGVHEGIYVGDRGMKSEEVLENLHARGFHYILAEVNRNVEDILLAAPKRPVVAVSERNQVRELTDREGRRYVVLLNEERRKTELETLERRIAQGRAILAELRRSWAKRPRHHHALLRQAHAALAAKGLGGLFEIDWDDATIQGLTAKLKESAARQRRFAGWWALATDTSLPAEEVARLYIGLAVIEQGWRELKSVLEVRPIRHRLERRVAAHLLICVLAYLLERSLELALRARKLTGARALDRFRTVTLDELELGSSGITRRVVTELEAGQQDLLEAVGIDPEAFQSGWRTLD